VAASAADRRCRPRRRNYGNIGGAKKTKSLTKNTN
jgi:hypothetical protein